jgi:hypothetical protein
MSGIWDELEVYKDKLQNCSCNQILTPLYKWN